MYELFDTVIRFCCEFLFWPAFIFVSFCIADVLFPEEKT